MRTSVRFLYGSFIVILAITIGVLVVLATAKQPSWMHVPLALWAAVIAFFTLRGIDYYAEILECLKHTGELDE